MSKILIIGGTGYLGRHLSKVLTSNNELFITSRHKNQESNSLVFDLEDSTTYCNIDFNSFDIVLMLVSTMYGIQSKKMNYNTFNLNCLAYKNLLNYLVEINYSNKIVYISSMTVYSSKNNSPVDEKGSTISPPNPYGLSKLIAEQLTEFYCHENDFNGVIIRIPGLFGGDRNGGFIYNAIDKIFRNEDFHISTENLKYWEAISVTDVSDMLLEFLNKYEWEKDCETYNISYGCETDILETAYYIKEKLKSKSKITTTNPKGYVPFYLSNEKYKSLTNKNTKNFKDSLLTYIKTVVK